MKMVDKKKPKKKPRVRYRFNLERLLKLRKARKK